VDIVNSINLGISVNSPGKRLRATVLRAMISKWQILSGATETIIRCPPPPVSTARITIIPDVSIAGREREYADLCISGSYHYFKERLFCG